MIRSAAFAVCLLPLWALGYPSTPDNATEAGFWTVVSDGTDAPFVNLVSGGESSYDGNPMDVFPKSEQSCELVSSPFGFDPEDMAILTKMVMEWGSKTKNKVVHRSAYAWKYKTAFIGVCNCKRRHDDPLPRGEVQAFTDAMDSQCGGGVRASGHVYSKKWKKGFQRHHSDKLLGNPGKGLCHKRCAKHGQLFDWDNRPVL